MGGMGAGSYGGRTHDMRLTILRAGSRTAGDSGALGTARGERMRQSFEDEGVKAAFDELGTAAPKSGECRIYPLTLSGGFQYPEIKVAVIASGDVYGAKSAKGKPKKQQGSKIASFTGSERRRLRGATRRTVSASIRARSARTSEGASRDTCWCSTSAAERCISRWITSTGFRIHRRRRGRAQARGWAARTGTSRNRRCAKASRSWPSTS